MDDAEAHEFYKNPAHLKIMGPGRKPQRPAKSSMTAVRFTPETIEAVKAVAHTEGVTVSSWIRRLVQRELQKRPVGLIPGSARVGERKALRSSLSLRTSAGGTGYTFRCPHMCAGNVESASCWICGPLTPAA